MEEFEIHVIEFSLNLRFFNTKNDEKFREEYKEHGSHFDLHRDWRGLLN